MIDLHNHVLFGLDDGCRNIEESEALSKNAKAAGHQAFVATPHIRPGLFNNTPETIRPRFEATRSVVMEAGLECYLGAEYYFDASLLEAARAESLLTLGETTRYVLTEFPEAMLPTRYAEVLFEIRIAGYVPVIAHPERCRGIQSDLDKALESLQQVDVLFQLDLGSLIGHYGKSAQKTAVECVKRGLYHVAACDLHRPEDVDAIVKNAQKKLHKLLKKKKIEEAYETWLHDNPKRILQNAPREEII